MAFICIMIQPPVKGGFPFCSFRILFSKDIILVILPKICSHKLCVVTIL